LRKCIPAIIALFGLMLAASYAHADASLRIEMRNRTDGVPVEAASDAEPELQNNRVMVPLRVISEHLGARVLWTGREAVLAKGGTTIRLRPGSDTATVNGMEKRLDAEPYASGNRVMVPLRFVAEMFDCEVRYENRTVTVATKPYAIDGVDVAAFRIETFGVLGSLVEDVVGNGHIEALHHAIEAGKGEKVEPPVSIAPKAMLAGSEDWYPAVIYDFLDRGGSSVRHYELYSRPRNMDEPELEYHLLYAAHEDQWHKLPRAVYFELDQLQGMAARHGYRIVVENSIP
jgi:hypothetical protein